MHRSSIESSPSIATLGVNTSVLLIPCSLRLTVTEERKRLSSRLGATAPIRSPLKLAFRATLEAIFSNYALPLIIYPITILEALYVVVMLMI